MNSFDWVAVVQQINRDFYAIRLCREGISSKVTQVRSIPLIDRETGEPVSKDEFKEIGGAAMIAESAKDEITTALVANAIETFQIRMKRYLKVDWDPFREPRDKIRFANRVRLFRALNNVYKHNEGFIEAASSKSARFLVNGGAYRDETHLQSRFPAIDDAEQAIVEVYTHLFLVCASESAPQIGKRFLKVSGKALIDEVNSAISYEIVDKHSEQAVPPKSDRAGG